MHWLHFSDFHTGRRHPGQKVAFGELLRFIEQRLALTAENVSAVFLVGDITFSGIESEYKSFEDDFLNPLRKISQVADAKVFCVPGNHDVDCDASYPITWDSIRPRNQQRFFLEDDEGGAVRKQRVSSFQAYEKFVTRNNLLSPLPSEEVSRMFSDDGLGVDILCVNTAFFSDREEDSSKPTTPSPITSMRERLRSRNESRPLIILGHHPVEVMLPNQQEPFKTFLIDRQATYLHGHEHRTRVGINANGTLRSLGFGATYLTNIEQGSSYPYENSFSQCWLKEHYRLSGFSWNSAIGRWQENTQTQFAECITADTFSDGQLSLGCPVRSRETLALGAQDSSPAIAPRRSPVPTSIGLISLPGINTWQTLAATAKNLSEHGRRDSAISIQEPRAGDNKVEITWQQDDRRDLLVCIAAPGHVLSEKEVESLNTRLDSEDLNSISVLSFGKISKDAKNLYLRLQSRKSLEIHTNADIAKQSHALLSPLQYSELTSRDAGNANASLLIDGDNIYLLIETAGESKTFEVLDSEGELLRSSHHIVAKVRSDSPHFRDMVYIGEENVGSNSIQSQSFDENEYLRHCYKEHNSLKYAALANVGIRFSDFMLESLYVTASASEVNAANASHIDELLDDHLAAYPVSDRVKEAIKQKLQSASHDDARAETSQALEYCQKYGAVLLTGDPGSGKTCFLKSEILAYCRRSLNSDTACDAQSIDDWHSLHVPIMISLSTIASDDQLKDTDLLSLSHRILDRKGIHFPSEHMRSLEQEGRLALFLDGLDEIVSVEKRAIVVEKINALVSSAVPLGNRIVVTSRPAAINVVNLLPSLKQLELQGLTKAEITALASGILRLRLAESAGDVVLESEVSQSPDSSILASILDDCERKPGIARIAQNPLLLTLLVIIYANSGAPSARRHKIYEEAIKTLASVRSIETGHARISEQDLRERLGAVALSVYRNESGLLPTRLQVSEVVQRVMSRQLSEQVSITKADDFIQNVAESTGLIVIGGDATSSDNDDVVTFMHHSFMEYFAAVGLNRDIASVDLVSLVEQPRWVEVLTLLSGIIGESEDIAPVLSKFLGQNGRNYGRLDAHLLTFALDCALECDVPSEAALMLLRTSLRSCLIDGPAKSDPGVRSDLGLRISQLMRSCGVGIFDKLFSDLIMEGSEDVAAATIFLTVHSFKGDLQSPLLLSSFEKSCSRREDSILAALCFAASHLHWFRTAPARQVIGRSLGRSVRCKRAAYEAILSIPGLAAKHWPEIIKGLDDSDARVKRVASQAAVNAGLDGNIALIEAQKKKQIARAIEYACEHGHDSDYALSTIRSDTVDRLLRSNERQDRLIGIQVIPAVDGTAEFAYKKLTQMLSESEDHEETAAILRALRISREAQALFTIGDLRIVTRLASEGTADVRRAAIYLLSLFGQDDVSVLGLLDLQPANMGDREYAALCFALARTAVRRSDVIRWFDSELDQSLGKKVKRNRSFESRLFSLLESITHYKTNLSVDSAKSIRGQVEDFKASEELRGASLKALAVVAVPDRRLVDYFVKLLSSPDGRMLNSLVSTPQLVAYNCRQSVENVIACVESLISLRAKALAIHESLIAKSVGVDTESQVATLRDGICEISQIVATFEEFIDQGMSKN